MDKEINAFSCNGNMTEQNMKWILVIFNNIDGSQKNYAEVKKI